MKSKFRTWLNTTHIDPLAVANDWAGQTYTNGEMLRIVIGAIIGNIALFALVGFVGAL